MTPHSPTPWKKHPEWANRLLDATGNWTACEVPGSYNSPSVIADADYILLCVNAHEALVDAAKLTVMHFKRNQASGNFQGDDEHEAWTALTKALEGL